ncbi:hypothetical protein DPMN_028524 [Dreissena polymorpha]|uniref:Uncharacterized protein n=1 Tax=Dreissena polymorpha TaxID=45954 RepID=A0A9D4RGJ5_DREPO|nr:hypothetical protein DPMN_028524 [Dreissena polymorpha]
MRVPLRRPGSGKSSSEHMPNAVLQRQPLVLARSRLNTVPLLDNNNKNNNNNNINSRGPLGKVHITSPRTSNNVHSSQNSNTPNNLSNHPDNNSNIVTSSLVNKLGSLPDVIHVAPLSVVNTVAGEPNTNAVQAASTVNTVAGIPNGIVANSSTDPFFHELVHELVNILDPSSLIHTHPGNAAVQTQGMTSLSQGHTLGHHHAVPSQSVFGPVQMLASNAVPVSNFHAQMGFAHAHTGMFGGPLGVHPWLMDPSFRQEMMFGDTTDPPEPVHTTTAAPNLVTTSKHPSVVTTPTTLTVLPVAITTEEAVASPSVIMETSTTVENLQPVESANAVSKAKSKLIVEKPLSLKPEEQNNTMVKVEVAKPQANKQAPINNDNVKVEVADTQINKQTSFRTDTVKAEVANTHVNKQTPINEDSVKVAVANMPISKQTPIKADTVKEVVANTQGNEKMVTDIEGMLSNSQLDKTTVIAAIKLVARQLGELPAALQTIAGQLGITLESAAVTTPATRHETLPSIEQLGIWAGATTGNVSRREIVEQLKGATRGVVVYPPTTQATRQAANPDVPTLIVETIVLGSKHENKTHVNVTKPLPVAAAQIQPYPAQPEVYQTLRTILDHNPRALMKVIAEAPTVRGTPSDNPEVSVHSLVDGPGAGVQDLKAILNNMSKHATGSQSVETYIHLSPYTTVSSVASEVIKNTQIPVLKSMTTVELSVPQPTVIIPKLANFEGVPVKITDISVEKTTSNDPSGVGTILNEKTGTIASSSGKHEALISEKLSNPEFVAALKRVLTRMLAENATLPSVTSRGDVMTQTSTLITTSLPLITTTEEIELEDVLTVTPTNIPTTPEP